jgi:sulfonate transport system permease protein
MSRFVSYVQRRWIGIVTIAALLGLWELAAHLAPKTPLAQTPLVPSWEFTFGPSLLGMADYWPFPFWAPITSRGGPQTLYGALLALAYHSSLTWFRLLSGLLIGSVIGIVLGLAVSWSPMLRRLTSTPLTILRIFPLLAMIPLFQFWVGSNTAGVIAFVAYGTAVIYLIGTINAVSNVPDRYLEYARTLGSSRIGVFRTVILPCIVPELLSSVLLTLGLAWSAVIAAEYIGIDTGLGRIMIMAQFMSQTGRMLLIAVILVAYASVSYMLFHKAAEYVLRWMPRRVTGGAAGRAAGAARPVTKVSKRPPVPETARVMKEYESVG